MLSLQRGMGDVDAENQPEISTMIPSRSGAADVHGGAERSFAGLRKAGTSAEGATETVGWAIATPATDSPSRKRKCDIPFACMDAATGGLSTENAMHVDGRRRC